MSKNVKILEDSTEKVLQDVAKIQTNLSNGSKCNWIPADSVPLGTLTVTEDGVYKASEDPNGPYYGYSQVNVSGVGNVVMGTLGELTVTENGTYEAANDASGPYLGYSKVIVNVPKDSTWHGSSGTVGKDDDGDDAIAVVNPETGEIEIHKMEEYVPVRIEVTTPPYNPYGTYNDGQTITKDGMVVTAYMADDSVWGVVPIEEVYLRPSVATYDRYNAKEFTIDDLTLLDYPYMTPIVVSEVYGVYDAPSLHDPTRGYRFNIEGSGIIYAVCWVTGNSPYMTDILYLSRLPFKTGRHWGIFSMMGTPTASNDASYYEDSLIGGYYCSRSGTSGEDPPHPKSSFSRLPPTTSIGDFARQIWYNGEHPSGIGYEIFVSWRRPGDDQELLTSFDITIVPPMTEEE